MKQASKLLLMAITLVSCVGCDQVTKNVARSNLMGNEPLTFLGNMVQLQYIENPGAFLSLGAGVHEQSRFWIFTVCTGFLLAGMLCYLLFYRNIRRAEIIAVSLVIGGGVANLIDRVYNHGRVIDFINVGIGPVRTGIFNVADVSITVGVLLLILFVNKRYGCLSEPES